MGRRWTKSKFIVLIMVVFSLSLGGCSFFNGQSAKKQEMIQIAESQKMKVGDWNYVKDIDPEALTPQGKYTRIKSWKINWNTIQWEGWNVYLVINGDKKLTIDTTVQMEDSGQFGAGSTVFQQN